MIVHRSAGEIVEVIPVEEADLSRYIQVGKAIAGGPAMISDKINLRKQRPNGQGFQVWCRPTRSFLPDKEVPTTVNYFPLGEEGGWVIGKMCPLCLPANKAAERLLKSAGILEPNERVRR